MLISAIRIIGLFAAGASAYVMVRVLWPDVRRAWRRRQYQRRGWTQVPYKQISPLIEYLCRITGLLERHK